MNPNREPDLLRDRMRGVLLGTAVGDALGLPLEGLGPRRARKLFRPPTRHRLLPGRGMPKKNTPAFFHEYAHMRNVDPFSS